MNRLGVQGYTIRDYINTKEEFAATLRKLHEIGYTCLDHGIPAGMTAREFKELLHDNGFEPLKVGTDVYSLLADPGKYINDAHELGVDLVMALSIPKDMRYGEAGYHQFAADMNRAANMMHAEGLRLGYHFHSFEFCSFGGYNGMDILLNETEYMELVPDTHWIAGAGINPPDFIRRLNGRCKMVHFKDYGIDAGPGILETVPRIYAEVGEGNLNWPAIVQACKEIGVNTFCVEQDFCKVDPFHSLTISYQAMKRLGL